MQTKEIQKVLTASRLVQALFVSGGIADRSGRHLPQQLRSIRVILDLANDLLHFPSLLSFVLKSPEALEKQTFKLFEFYLKQ